VYSVFTPDAWKQASQFIRACDKHQNMLNCTVHTYQAWLETVINKPDEMLSDSKINQIKSIDLLGRLTTKALGRQTQ